MMSAFQNDSRSGIPRSQPRTAVIPEGYRIGPFELEPRAASLSREGIEVAVAPKSLAMLIYLVRMRHRIVPRSELLDVIWRGVSVSETAVASVLRDLRRALGDDGREPRFVVTRKGLGYRFIHPVENHGSGDAPAADELPGESVGLLW